MPAKFTDSATHSGNGLCEYFLFLPHFDVICDLLKAGKKPRSDFLSEVNFTLGQVKIEVQWPSEQVKLQCSLSSLVSLTKNASLRNDNFQSFHFKT